MQQISDIISNFKIYICITNPVRFVHMYICKYVLVYDVCFDILMYTLDLGRVQFRIYT